MKRRLAALVAACALEAFAQAAAPAPRVVMDGAALEKRLASVETLIERSSAAKQIEASAAPGALARREQARATLKRAREAFASPDVSPVPALLNEASAQFFEAVKLAAPEQVTGGKRRADIAARLESARALASAQKRIAGEKTAQGGNETMQAIERLLREAEAQLAKNDLDAANASVEQGYLLAKAAIGSMRSGDTLVRSLNFASKAEEYAYEIDRNDTHRMLLDVLLDSSKSERAQPAIEQSRLLRAQAEGAARSGDHGAAIRMLEDSTRELVRAIRAAGIYIPG